MTSWRDEILSQFTLDIAAVARFTIVADPDHLLTEPGIVEALRDRGFEIMSFDDHVSFRYAYELRFRRVWDSGQSTQLVVALRPPQAELTSLPFDLVEAAKRESRILSFSLANLFPKLQPAAVADLDRTDLDDLFAACTQKEIGALGLNATRDFVLRQVFGIEPEIIRTPADLLRVLLRRHHNERRLPASLDEHLVKTLRGTGRWDGWPLEDIVPNRAVLLEFLQERWPIFLGGELRKRPGNVSETQQLYGPKISGPIDLPFGHDDVRVYVDTFFVEGLLKPTNLVPKSSVQGTWMTVGVVGDEVTDKTERLRKLLTLLEQDMPSVDSEYQPWLRTAYRWAEAMAIRWEIAKLAETDQARFDDVHRRVEADFDVWLKSHHASLANLTPWPGPVMVHHVAQFMAHKKLGGHSPKNALLVVDGLALDQWAVIRQELPSGDWFLEDGGLFAWIPTLTTVSRQAIFAAEPPFFFAGSIQTTGKEEQMWTRFWEDQGLPQAEVAYVCQSASEQDDDVIKRVNDCVQDKRCSALAVVIGTIDRMLHGEVRGSDGLHAGIRHWAQRGSLFELIDLLLRNGFEVILTSDHGNVESVGVGKPNVGDTVEQQGERVLIFKNELLRADFAKRCPYGAMWPTSGLPVDYLPFIASGQGAFVQSDKHSMAHGGTSIEEVIVPFVQIRVAT